MVTALVLINYSMIIGDLWWPLGLTMDLAYAGGWAVQWWYARNKRGETRRDGN